MATESDPFDLSPGEAAAIIGVHEDTLKRWAQRGDVPAFKTLGGWWRFRLTDLEAFKASRMGTSEPTEAAS